MMRRISAENKSGKRSSGEERMNSTIEMMIFIALMQVALGAFVQNSNHDTNTNNGGKNNNNNGQN
jgi:hypothetical protein